MSLNEKEDAIYCLRQAKAIALRFDEAPNYDAANIRFVSCEVPATAFDDFGDTAMLSVDSVVMDYENNELIELWGTIKNEK